LVAPRSRAYALGYANHRGPSSLDDSRRSRTWRLPAPYYTFTAGAAQLFALDTNEVSEAQLLWLDQALSASRSRWRIVYGHHPIYSAGDHRDNEALIARLQPCCATGWTSTWPATITTSSTFNPTAASTSSSPGGRSVRPPRPKATSLFAAAVLAFTVVEADAQRLRIVYLDTDLKPLYEHVLREPNPPGRAASPVP
jgi:hypothetical protein